MATRIVLFHCPACGADRLGEARIGRWSSWTRDDNDSRHVTCVGCRRTFHHCSVAPGITGMSYRAVLNSSVRAMAASLYAVSDGSPRTTAAVLEMVRSFTSLTYSHVDLRMDATSSTLAFMLRGELTLLARILQRDAARQLVEVLRAAAEADVTPSTAQARVIDDVTRYLGVDEKRPAVVGSRHA